MDDLQSIVKSLSKSPGVYQFLDHKNTIIYIGKAKNLKNRVSSYFNKIQFENRKTKLLVSQICDIKTIKVETEMDALLLENILVKNVTKNRVVIKKMQRLKIKWMILLRIVRIAAEMKKPRVLR